MFLPIDLAFFGANLLKIADGGWFPLAGRRRRLHADDHLEARPASCCASGSRRPALPLELFLPDLETTQAAARAGHARCSWPATRHGTPLALLHNVKHNKVVHEQIVLLTLADRGRAERARGGALQVKPLGQGFFRLVAHYGFMEVPDVPALLRKARSRELPIDPASTSYFLGRERLIPSGRSGMMRWRECLFSVMSQNAQSASTFFGIPPGQVVELGAQVEL